MNSVLKMENITKRFPGIVANEDINFELREGEIHALLGENGAGKSTLMNILYGLYEPDEGAIYVNDKVINIRSPHDAIAAGIGMVHQHFKLVPTLTVAENITLGQEITRGSLLLRRKMRDSIQEISDRFGIKVSPNAVVSDLSVGERQRVEILKMLYRGADILILDEPTAVLTPPEITPLFRTLKTMVEGGKQIVFITHKLKEVKEISDRVTVLRRGGLIGTVLTDTATESSLAEMMVGREVALTVSRTEKVTPGPVVALMSGIRVAGESERLAVRGVDLEVRAGEIVAIAGVDGNGQSELAEAIAGLRTLQSGKIYLGEEDYSAVGPADRNSAGLWYVPADRHKHGSLPALSLVMNAILKHHRWAPFSKSHVIQWAKAREFTERLINEYDVRCSSIEDSASTLSGGNLQKLILSRETVSKPRFLIAEQPVRGLDVNAIEFVRRLLLRQRSEQTGVLLISADLEEILALADRIVVMYEGRVVYRCNRDEVDMNQLGLAMAGRVENVGEVVE